MHGSYRACFPVFSYFSKIFLFSRVFFCFLLFALFFFVVFFFQVKILNFRVFSYSGFLQILENLEKSTNFIKVREKSWIFFILKAVCIYFLSFLRMINFFLVYFLAYFLYVHLIERSCFKALFGCFTFTSFFG